MMNYVKLDKRLLNAKYKTMSNFDFNKAINGEPIYCNGKLVEDISWRVARNEFELNLFIAGNPEVDDLSGMVYFDKNGCIKNTIGCTFPENKFNLTTDPPKKKVKKTVHLFKSKVSISVILRINDDTFPEEKCWYKCGETEIEVEE